MDRGLIEYIENPEIVKAVRPAVIKNWEPRRFYYIRKGIDAIMWGQDFSYNSGPMLSQKCLKFVLQAVKPE